MALEIFDERCLVHLAAQEDRHPSVRPPRLSEPGAEVASIDPRQDDEALPRDRRAVSERQLLAVDDDHDVQPGAEQIGGQWHAELYATIRRMSQDDRYRPGWRDAFIATWLIVQIVLPLSYYVRAATVPTEGEGRADLYDERFTWRMFSPVRMLRCTPEYLVNGEGPVSLERHVHSAWISLLKRGRMDVVEAVSGYLCAQPGTESVRLELRCREADGSRVTIVHGAREWCL